MSEILKQNEISPEQEVVISHELKNIAKCYRVGFNELNRIANKENKKEQEIKMKEYQKNLEHFKNFIDPNLQKLRSYVGMHFLMHAGRIEDSRIKEEDFNALCKKHKLTPPQNRKQAEEFIEVLDKQISSLVDKRKQLIKKGLLPNKQIRVKRSSGKIEDDWIIKEYIEDGDVKVVNLNKHLRKIIPVDKLLFLN